MASKINELMQIGLRLSNSRQNRNMTQEELAGRLGITPQAVSKWERGASLPDISMLADLAGILEVSTDWLLGLCEEPEPKTTETNPAGVFAPDFIQNAQSEMGKLMRGSLAPLELVFGTEVVPAFLEDSPFAELIHNMRRRLAGEGTWVPIIRLRDNNHAAMGKKEFMVLSFHNVLYSEVLETVDERTSEYMIGKLEETIRNKYHEILYPDLMKNIVDNLKVRYPALIEDIVPEKISYGLLTETAKIVLSKGNSLCYLPKMIEIMECTLRQSPAASAQELAAQIILEICRNDNFYLILGQRPVQNT
nr:helix-turn-helix domain-containing protein [uncultured Acetatifactor sp.]